jgi:hypothetical protein
MGFKQAIDTRGCILDQLKRLLVANLCCFLLDKRGLGLRCGEQFFDLVNK